jgi:hypothetical protein
MKSKSIVFAATVLLSFTQASNACPNCKDGIAHYDAANGRAGASTNGLQAGFNYSVLFMLAVPASILTVGVTKVRKLAREGRLPEF